MSETLLRECLTALRQRAETGRGTCWFCLTDIHAAGGCCHYPHCLIARVTAALATPAAAQGGAWQPIVEKIIERVKATRARQRERGHLQGCNCQIADLLCDLIAASPTAAPLPNCDPNKLICPYGSAASDRIATLTREAEGYARVAAEEQARAEAAEAELAALKARVERLEKLEALLVEIWGSPLALRTSLRGTIYE